MLSYRTLVILVSLFLQACSFAPGMYVDMENLSVDTREDAGFEGNKPVIIPITPAFISAQNKQVIQQQKEKAQADSVSHYQYKVGVGDILSIIVWDHPELTTPAGEFRSADMSGSIVKEDGKIFYPYIGDVRVINQTTDQIRKRITFLLRKYVKNPQLDVRVVSFRSKKVFVTGEVNKPGIIYIDDRPLTVLDAINKSLGATKEADLSKVVLTRNNRSQILDIQKLFLGDSKNIQLQDGDQIYLPDQSENKIFILGEVNKPSVQLMNKGRMSLAEALSLAEGMNLSSDGEQLYVIRGSLKQPEFYQLDMKRPDALLVATMFELKPKDVIYVAVKPVARWNRIMKQIVPSIQALYQTDVLIRSFNR